MKARCPACRTTFRVTPEQLKARAGQVRCGQCRTVFNALDSLLDDEGADGGQLATPPPAPATRHPADDAPLPRSAEARAPHLREARTTPGPVVKSSAPPPASVALKRQVADLADQPAGSPIQTSLLTSASASPEAEAPPAHEPAPAAAPRSAIETSRSEAPSRVRSESGTSSEAITPQRPYRLAAGLLVLSLAAQIVFHFRTPIANSAPALRPAFEALSVALGSDMPLSRHADLLSIESSDLHADPARDRLLALQATLRNRANHAQAYPALELTLTDTSDRAIARRVLLPDEYLPGPVAGESAFAARSEVEVRLWLEAREINAAGYRLYVFYP